jgi:hypothetical protein
MTRKAGLFPLSRRQFMAGSAALAGTASLGVPRAFAQARFTRKSLESPDAARDLASYKKAVKAMLALPPEDPRNWYRNAFTHLMDCPHGNWWFLVWHRGFLAHFEQICREMSGDPDFALPFWDWTAEPKIPDSFWDDVLDPGHSEYLQSKQAFESALKPAMQTYWNGLSSAQRHQQDLRGFDTFETLWQSASAAFRPYDESRSLTQAKPDLTGNAREYVKPNVVRDLLAPAEYVTTTGDARFGSAEASNHHGHGAGYSILEGQPHNWVHDDIGGFMLQFLSPTDPIFFMHHCNIDRLWDVWTRKQEAAGRSTRPPANLWDTYRREPFLFFHQADGSPATATTAEDYFRTAPFEYDYAPGSGDEAPSALIASAAEAVPTAGTENLNLAFASEDAAQTPVAVPRSLSDRLAASSDGQRFFAAVTITPPMQREGLAFNVFIGPEGAPLSTDPDGDNLAASFTFFGPGHHAGPSTFTVGITEAVERLRAAGSLKPGQDLQVAVRTETLRAAPMVAQALSETPVRLNAVKIGTF